MRRTVLALLLGALATACYQPPLPWLAPAPDAEQANGVRVAVLGDSLVYRAETDETTDETIENHLLTDLLVDRGYTASVGGRAGASYQHIISEVPRLPSPAPDVIVIGAGSNDAHDGYFETTEIVENLLLAAEQSAARCTVLVTVAETEPWQLHIYGAALNAAFRQVDAERGDVTVADWATVAAQNPEYLAEDGVHHTSAGRAAYRELLADGADTCTATLPPPS